MPEETQGVAQATPDQEEVTYGVVVQGHVHITRYVHEFRQVNMTVAVRVPKGTAIEVIQETAFQEAMDGVDGDMEADVGYDMEWATDAVSSYPKPVAIVLGEWEARGDA